MRILVCGDRHWQRDDIVFWVVQMWLCENYDDDPLVIEGAARGADTHGRLAAKRLGVPFLEFRADWATHGRAAGPIRNRKQHDEGRPDVVLAFHDDITNSRGTRDMVKYAMSRGTPCLLYDSQGNVQTLTDS